MRTFAALTIAIMTFAQAKQIIRTGPDLGLPFSPAVKAGGLIYVAGSLATDAQGQVIKGDVKAQTRQVLENHAATLKAAGSSLANAASVMVYLRSARGFAGMTAASRSTWPTDR